ncbi:MAG: ankyrin repeat domain-containing protein [Thermoguttaceae bacterium]|nr:ankyrin repeat domain-containing protein [Thermoguttaceae bacterium]
MRPAVSIPAFFLLGAMSLPWSTAFCADPQTLTEEQTSVSAQQTPVSASLSSEEIHELQETAFQAAERGDGDEVLRCVRLGADPWSWMSCAARKCRPETMEAILKHTREHTPADEAWITEAHIAYSNRNWLNNAVSAGNLAMAEYLLDHFGTEISQYTQYTLLFEAAESSIEMFDFLQKRFQLPYRFDTKFENGKELILLAAGGGNLPLVRRFLQQNEITDEKLREKIIFEAHKSENRALVHFLFKQGFPLIPGSQQEKHQPPKPDTQSVAEACETGDLTLVNAALARSRGIAQPALNNAVRSGNLAVVKRILDAGAYIDELEMGMEDELEDSALDTAFKNKHFHIADLLLERGIDPHLVPLETVCAAGNAKYLKKMYRLWNETEPRKYYPVKAAPQDVLSAGLFWKNPEIIRYAVEELHAITKEKPFDVEAFRYANRPILEYLLRHSPGLELTGEEGEHLLNMAGWHLDLVTLEFFDAHGFKFASSKAAVNALCHAVEKENDLAIQFLLEKGVPAGVPDQFRRTAIECVRLNSPTTPRILDLLISQYGQDPLGRNLLLIRACARNEVSLISSLLAEGKVDVNARNFRGETPLLALAGSYMPKLETLQLLLDRGADIHARDDEGNTVLHRPFFWLDVDLQVMEFLVKQGVDRSVKNHDGKTALDLYRKSRYRHPSQLETLLDPQTPIVHEWIDK